MRIGVASALAGAVALIAAALPAAARDNRDYCADDATNVVLYIDVTTPYDEVDKSALVDGVGRIFATLMGGERFSIRTIEDAFPNSKRILERCVPVCTGGFFGDMFSDCTEGARIEDSRTLQRDIATSIAERLAAAVELPHSEIVRTLAMSGPEEYRKGRANAFFVFSDMIENSEFLPGSDFLTVPEATLVERLATDGLIPDLIEADIRIFGVGRGVTVEGRPALSQEKLQKVTAFWTLFFKATGATVTMRPNLSTD